MMASKHWATINEVGSTKGMWILFHIYKILGKVPFRIVLYPVMGYYYFRSPIARESIKEYYRNLKNHFTDSKDIQKFSVSNRTIFRHYLSFAETILDKILSNTGSYQLDNVNYVNRNAVLKYLQQKQGVLILTGHIGNLELCRAVAQFKDVKINVLVHTANSQQFNRMMRYANVDHHVNFIEVSSVGPADAAILSQKVSQGEIVVIAADRVPLMDVDQHSIPINFLGKQALLPMGPYVLAHVLQCPVVTMFCIRISAGYQIGFNGFSEQVVLPRIDRYKHAKDYAQQFADHMALYCKIAPNQWFNFYPFWQYD